ncbi:GNAT family N-acetyltransferase [Undibacterium sp. TJN19]|uniref:GNAT family N-acetyltransferase n=1 Tax=Undibacterium sp. TJN19 TaxID=3413055 RepID=UPI003BF32FA1
MTIIRPSTIQDAAQIQGIYQHCVIDAAWQIRPAHAIADFASSSQGELVLVATDGPGQGQTSEKILAVLAVQVADSYIHHLYVHPEAKGRGLGKSLLLYLQDFLPFPWRLKCVTNNHAALAFYQHLGWREVASGHSVDGPYVLLELSAPLFKS